MAGLHQLVGSGSSLTSRPRCGFGCVAVLALLLAGCAPPAFDADSLAAGFPELGRDGASRLADVTPFLLPAHGRVTWLLCRFDTGVPIPVWVAEDASETERRGVEAALEALQRSGLGVRFVRVPREQAAIALEFVDGAVPTAIGRDRANTVADCRLEASALPAPNLDRLPAQLHFASVLIGRSSAQDALGRPQPVGTEELTGLVLHELGHALGFSGHTASSGSVMSRDPDSLRRAGGAALAKEPLDDPSLGALYSVPSGTVVSRVEVAPARTQLVDRMARVAEQHDLAGPFLRVGDHHARVFWRDGGAKEYGLQVSRVRELLHDATRIVVLPEARTRRVLPRERDVRLDSN